MRYAYGALVLTSLLLQKEIGRGPALHSWDTGSAKDMSAQPHPEDSRQLRFVNTFREGLPLSWLAKTPLGAGFLGLAVLLFCLLAELWASSRVATWRARPQPAATGCSVREPGLTLGPQEVGGFQTAVRPPWARTHPLQAPCVAHGWQFDPELNPELEREQDDAQHTWQGTNGGWLAFPYCSPYSCHTSALPAPPCTSGKCLGSSINSYPVTYKATLHGQGSKMDGYPEDHRSRSPLRGSIIIRTTSSSSSSSSSSSCSCPFSSTSSSLSSSPPHPEQQDWRSSYRNLLTATQDSLGMRPDSTDELESQGSDPGSKLDDPNATESTLESSCILLVPQRPPERERVSPWARATPGHFPEGARPWALPPFAQLNIRQSSAYGRENDILLVANSLEIHIGPAPVPVGKGAPPESTFPDQRLVVEKPTGLPRWSHHVSFLCRDARAKHQLRDVPEEASPRGSPKARQPPPKQGKLLDSPCQAGNVDPVDLALKNIDEVAEQCLECHIKKKMVQRHCGLPSVVVWSLRLFHALEDYHLEQLESRQAKATPKLLLIPIQAVSTNHLDSPAGDAKHIQGLRGSQADDVPHPLVPEKTKKLALSSPGKPLGMKREASQGPRAKYVLLSVDPDDLRRLLFHTLVKMLDIKKANFPIVVENSFRRAGSLSSCPLPKLIRRGIKTPRPKSLALPFMPGEALYLIDLNIRHKYLVYTWKLPVAYTTSTAERTSAPSWHPRGPKGGIVKAEAHSPALPVLLLTHPKGKVLPAGPLQLLRLPASKKPPSMPPPAAAPVEATPPDGCDNKPPGGHAEKQPEEKRPPTGVGKRLHLHLEKSICLLEVSAKTSPGHAIPSGHEEAPHQGPTPTAPPPSSTVASLEQSPIQGGGAAKAKEGMGATSVADTAAKGDPSREAKDGRRLGPTASGNVKGLPPETEGQMKATVLPLDSLEEGEEVDRRTAAEEEARGLQLEGELCDTVPSPSIEEGGGAAQKVPGGQTVALLPSSAGGNEDPVEKGKSAREKREGQGGPGAVLLPLDQNGARADGKGTRDPKARAREEGGGPPCQVPPTFSDQREAKAEDGGEPRAEEGRRARPKEASIVRASLFLELELAKEKLNLHLKKRLAATLRPPHRAALHLDLGLAKEAGRRRAQKATHQKDRGRCQAQAQPGRPFCYVSMPLDDAGSQVKRVCWYLPKWIQEMNGHRVPQVAYYGSEAAGDK